MSYPSLVASDGHVAAHLCVTQVWHLLPARLSAAHQGIFQMFQGFRVLCWGRCPRFTILTLRLWHLSLCSDFPPKFSVYKAVFLFFLPSWQEMPYRFWSRCWFGSQVFEVFVIKAAAYGDTFGLRLICVVKPPQFGRLRRRERRHFGFSPPRSLCVFTWSAWTRVQNGARGGASINSLW